MIVVFVVDTSPSMAMKLDTSSTIGMSKLDLAKMAVESMFKGLTKRVNDHNMGCMVLQQQQQQQQFMMNNAANGTNINTTTNNNEHALHNMGIGFSPPDQFLLLSTGQQYNNTNNDNNSNDNNYTTSCCGAGGRLLVGFGDYGVSATDNNDGTTNNNNPNETNRDVDLAIAHSHQSFERELKKLQPTAISSSDKNNNTNKFPEDGGGAIGMNAALSAGLGLLSRYRYKNRSTENFGMGRLPSPAMSLPSGSP